MQQYIGLDVHKSFIHACIMSREGKIVLGPIAKRKNISEVIMDESKTQLFASTI